MSQPRVADYPINPIFLDRWSPRAFSAEEISEFDLLTILEAARWAPSASNLQPWRFLYARRGTGHWAKFLDLLKPSNQAWARDAAALIVIVSRSTMVRRGEQDEVPSHSHSFDAGAAWGILAIQALMSGWHTHGMVGFDISRTPSVLNIPPEFRVEAAVALGRYADPAGALPTEAAREQPNGRRALAETAFAGGFPVPAK